MVVNAEHVHHSQTIQEALQNPKDICGRTGAADSDGPCGYEQVQLQE